MAYIQKNSPLNELKQNVIKKRENVSHGTLGLGDKQNRKLTGESVKSYGAQIATQIGVSTLASAGIGAAAGAVAAGARTAGNLIQNKVAEKRVAKYGQKGSAIVPNKSDKAIKSWVGEKTIQGPGDTATSARKAARNVRKQAKGKIYKPHSIEGKSRKDYKNSLNK